MALELDLCSCHLSSLFHRRNRNTLYVCGMVWGVFRTRAVLIMEAEMWDNSCQFGVFFC